MTQPKRYGTSSAECPNGICVLYSEYEKVAAERDALRADADRYRAIAGCCQTIELITHPDTREKWLFIAAKEGYLIGEPFVQSTHHIVDQFLPLARGAK